MKDYTITVNGNVYYVTVEEGNTAGAAAAAPVAAPAPKAAPKAAPAPAPAAAPKAAPKAAGTQGSVKVAAPMPGKILGIKASVGQAVKKGDVIVILEAMKMENEIVAPQDGTVASIDVANGDSVESGATLATLN
ncbi:MAG TPA: biotin/lipoyl-binding protein [Candidatus Hungatella pullicola]|nr:biotin/lipoyl-binding protein [Candidatus Hungatella pullicola]